jgi:hypothetical protein
MPHLLFIEYEVDGSKTYDNYFASSGEESEIVDDRDY